MRKILCSMIFLLLLGCYPDGPEYVDELDSVYTNYSPEFNFTQNYSYALPDGVLGVNGNPNADPSFIDSDFGDPMLAAIRSNLNAMGWNEVSEDDNPDIVVLVAALDSDFFYYDVDWWWWYYPGYFPGWGWYYPGYFPTYVGSFSLGTVVMQITYPADIANNEVPVVWVGAINGLLQGTDAYIITRATTGIDRAFMQPPFNN
ncbi:DUF4136 domain-containing protein [Flavobacterium beibuense]|uniref:DUF4136 domain-containing protein n=1 Tax=Flavobacterium beibuense TaxID=657326 RepID=UPI003A950826